MINVQKQIKEILKIAAETNMTITEIEDSILKASTNNWVINITNITGVSEDLQYLIQSDMEELSIPNLKNAGRQIGYIQRKVEHTCGQ